MSFTSWRNALYMLFTIPWHQRTVYFSETFSSWAYREINSHHRNIVDTKCIIFYMNEWVIVHPMACFNDLAIYMLTILLYELKFSWTWTFADCHFLPYIFTDAWSLIHICTIYLYYLINCYKLEWEYSCYLTHLIMREMSQAGAWSDLWIHYAFIATCLSSF